VSTVSRAIALVGFAGIRNMALSILLLDHLQDKEHARLLKDEFLHALMAGQLASEIAPLAREAEEVFIASMMRNLGRLLTGFYFPEEAQQIREQLRVAGADPALVSARVLGLTFEDLAVGVAGHWGLPDSLQAAMRTPPGEPPARLLPNGTDRVRWIATAANEVADALLAHEPGRAVEHVAAIAERHARALGIAPAQLKDAVGRSRQKLVQLASALQLDASSGSPARRLLQLDDVAEPAEPDILTHLELHAPGTSQLVADAPTVQIDMRPRGQVALMLSAGVQDITNSMVDEHFKLNEVLRMVLETMMRALDFQRVLLLLRDPRTEALVGRFGLGDRAAELAPHCRVPLRPAPGAPPDLFSAVCLKGADTLIGDATVDTIATRLPPWHRRHIGAHAFVLLPMVMKGAPLGLIYADKARAGSIELDEKELNLLRTLRNQAVMAFRQKS
jgi:eukaryotic-like serine/threonine-protein kinase